MAEERAERRLAAILGADLVGYSRLMGEDEEGTLNALNAHLAELMRQYRHGMAPPSPPNHVRKAGQSL